MGKRSELLFCIVMLILFVGIGAGVVEAGDASKVIKLKYSDMFPPVMDEAKVAEIFGDMVERATGGRVKITYYHAEALGKQKDIIEMMEGGICDISEVSPGIQPAMFDGLSQGFALPLSGITNRTVLNNIVWELYHKGYFKWDKIYSNYKVLAFQTMPSTWIFMSKKKALKAEDFKGLKIRSPDRKLDILLKNIGAVPVAIPGPEVYMALDRGMIDGLITTYTYVLGAKLYEASRYCIMLPMQINAGPIVMNKDAWTSLPQDIKTAIDDVIIKYRYEFFTYFQDKDSKAVELLTKNGMEAYSFDSSGLAPFKEAASEIRSDWIAEKEAAGMPAREMMELIDKILKRYQQ